MTINSSNFGQWQQAFLNGQLSPEQDEMLMLYLEQNPELIDLEHEVELPKLNAENITYDNKASLKRSETNIDGINDFDYLAVKQIEDGLTVLEQSKLDNLIANQPILSHDLKLYLLTKLQPDENVVFTHKSSLQHHELTLAPFMTALRYSATAAVIAGAVWLWWPQNNQQQAKQQLAQSQLVIKNDTSSLSPLKAQKNDTIEVEQHKPVNQKKNSVDEAPKMIELYVEPAEQLIASLPSKNALNALTQPEINGYEEGLNVMMPQYLDNQIEIARFYAYSSENTQPQRDNLSVKVLERGVRVFNLFGINKVKLDKYYDEDGNIVAYKLKGEGLQWSQRVK